MDYINDTQNTMWVLELKSEEFQALKKGQILIYQFGSDSRRLIGLITDVNHKDETCSILVCELCWSIGRRNWIPFNIFRKEHRNKSRYACDTWLDNIEYGAGKRTNKLTLLIECGRSVESILRESIHEEVRKRLQKLQDHKKSVRVEIKELYKGIRVL